MTSPTQVLSVRVSVSERDLLESAAAQGRTNLSDFVRRKAIEAAEIGRQQDRAQDRGARDRVEQRAGETDDAERTDDIERKANSCRRRHDVTLQGELGDAVEQHEGDHEAGQGPPGPAQPIAICFHRIHACA